MFRYFCREDTINLRVQIINPNMVEKEGVKGKLVCFIMVGKKYMEYRVLAKKV